MGERDRRDRIIDAALDVCSRCGYETTTIDQIATAAGLTPDDFVGYFPTKDAVVIGIVEELLHAQAAALQHVDASLGPEEALLAASTEVVVAVIDGRGVITRDRMFALQQVVAAQPSLRRQASSTRKRILTQALADQLGVAVSNRRVRQAVMKWSAVAGGAYFDRETMAANYDPNQDDQLEQRMRTELNATFAEVMGKDPSGEWRRG